MLSSCKYFASEVLHKDEARASMAAGQEKQTVGGLRYLNMSTSLEAQCVHSPVKESICQISQFARPRALKPAKATFVQFVGIDVWASWPTSCREGCFYTQ